MIFNLNSHLVSRFSYAKYICFYIFLWYSSSLRDLLMLISLINEVCIKLKSAKMLENYYRQ